MKYLRLLRVKHYIKNGLIFLPLFFAKQIMAADLVLRSLLAFAVFCLVSSVIYCINDIQDVEYDRKHPVKCKRPIASGEISKRQAAILCVLLLIGAVALIAFAGGGLLFWGVPALYLAVNVGYNMGLKNVPVIDIAILAAGYLLRVLYGSVFTGIPISGWMYLTVISIAFYLCLGKRRGEMRRYPTMENPRPVLKFYTQSFLEKNMLMCVTLGVVFYSLWSVDATTIQHVGGDRVVWTVPLVILIFFKYSMDVEGDSDGDPVEVIFQDKLLLALVAVLGIILFLVMYF